MWASMTVHSLATVGPAAQNSGDFTPNWWTTPLLLHQLRSRNPKKKWRNLLQAALQPLLRYGEDEVMVAGGPAAYPS